MSTPNIIQDIYDLQSEISGTVTSGSNTTITDTTKDFELNTLIGSVAVIAINEITYFRTIISNTLDTITIANLPDGVVASAGDTYKINPNTLNYVDLIFHDESITPNSGNEFNVGVYKTLTFEIYGTSTSRTVNFMVTSFNGSPRGLVGIKSEDGLNAISTTGTGEVWQLPIEGLKTVFFGLSAVDGGNVSIKGRMSR